MLSNRLYTHYFMKALIENKQYCTLKLLLIMLLLSTCTCADKIPHGL